MKPLLVCACLALAGCGSLASRQHAPSLTPEEARAAISGALPPKLADREGWAEDIESALTALEIDPSPANICAVLAITEQESSFRSDPAVPDLPRIALREMEARAAKLHVPRVVLHAALGLKSPTGKTYRERLDAARTERNLSEIYEDLISAVPLGRRLLADYNPVRTGGPMQVSIAFAEAYAREHRYPFASDPNIRREVFTRRGGLYFGTAHLLAYPADYDAMLYRFADFNAGHYASRNAAFQNALAIASGRKLALDGDLLLEGGNAEAVGQTENAARSLASRLKLDESQIRRDLQHGDRADFARTTVYSRTFDLAEKKAGRELPRAMTPQIVLQGPKISRQLTTDWFARRVDGRHQRCLSKSSAGS
jgi:hypothetical protein